MKYHCIGVNSHATPWPSPLSAADEAHSLSQLNTAPNAAKAHLATASNMRSQASPETPRTSQTPIYRKSIPESDRAREASGFEGQRHHASRTSELRIADFAVVHQLDPTQPYRLWHPYVRESRRLSTSHYRYKFQSPDAVEQQLPTAVL